MRSVGQFRAMSAEDRAAERVRLQRQESEVAAAESKLNSERAELDARLEAGYQSLAQLNRQAEAASRTLHDVRQDLAGLEAAEKQEASEAAGRATGTGVTAGAS
jgi:chromosome segregation ATPase